MKSVGLVSIVRVSFLLRGIGWVIYLCRRYLLPLGSKVAQLFKLALPWLLAIGLGLWLGGAIQSTSVAKVIATVLGLLLSIVLIIKPEYGVYTLVILTATVIGGTAIPKPLTFGGQGFAATELLVLFMLPVLWVRIHADRKMQYAQSPMTLPMLLFCLSTILAIVVRYEEYVANPVGPFPFKEVYNSVRPLFHYLFFFIVVYALDTKRKLYSFLRFLMWAACIVALMMVIQYFLGTNHWIFIGTDEKIQDYEGAELARPLPPGMSIVTVMFVVAVASSAFKTFRTGLLWSLAAAVILGIGLVFTNTRGIWLTSFLSVMMIWLVVGRAAKWRLGTIMLGSIIAVISLSFIVGRLAPGEAGRQFALSTQQRFLSIFEEKTVRSSSIQNRIKENRYIFQQIIKNPVLGIGAGGSLGYQYVTDNRGNYYIHPRSMIHNSYLELYAVYGLLGAVSFIWLTVAFFYRSFFVYKRIRDQELKAVILALVAAYVGYLLRYSYAMALLHELGSIITVSFVWGLVEVIWRISRAKADSDSHALASITRSST